MTGPRPEGVTQLRVLTYNLMGGGIDAGSRARLSGQVHLLDRQRADVIALQEAKPWDEDLVAEIGDQLGMTGYLMRASHYDCHQVLYVREPYVQVVKTRHDTAPPWWVGLACLSVRVQGFDLTVASVHLAPSSPTVRLAEAETLQLLAQREEPSVVVGDFNGLAHCDPLPTRPPGRTNEHYRRKTDRRAARAMAADFLDVATVTNDLTPTVGHAAGDRLAYRCDRIYTTLPADCIEDYWVLEEQRPASDHRPVMAVFRL